MFYQKHLYRQHPDHVPVRVGPILAKMAASVWTKDRLISASVLKASQVSTVN